MQRFTEDDTEKFYDEEDDVYRSFWDSEGSLHWGYFDDSTGDDFLTASRHLNDIMLTRSGIDASAHVLDLGCGNGNASIWLAEQTGCKVTGIDLSGVRVDRAKELLATRPANIQSLVEFKKASATDLPFPDNTFTHVWSQATIYHVHDKETALAEAYRVLQPGGTLVLDDLTKPKQPVSDYAQTHVYDRLLFDTPFSFEGYKEGLRSKGFTVVESEDIAGHLGKSYVQLGLMAAKAAPNNPEVAKLVDAYRHMVKAIEDGYLGWGLYLAKK